MSSVVNTTATSAEISAIQGSEGLLGPVLARTVVCLLSLLFVWRAWRFTVLPFLHPDQPKEFPYWIPFGLGKTHLANTGELMLARSYLGNTDDPFALTAFGMTFYVVTQAKHSAEVYRNTETLSFEAFVQGLMRINGNDEDIIKAVYTALPADKTGFPNPQGESLGVLAQRMHAHQLHPGENLAALQKQVQAWVDGHLNLADLASFPSVASTSPASIEVPLYQWCSEAFIQLGQDVYFGETLAGIDPALPAAFLAFDELIWKMLYRYPGFLSGDMAAPRARVIASLNRYFQVPPGQRRGGAAWLVNAMEDEMRAIGVEGKNLAIVVFHLYLAINTNARKTAFWMLSYLIHNPSLLAAYRAETAAAFGPSGALVDPLLIQEPARCPCVDAVWHETLRVSGWAASVRLVTADTVVGGKRLRRGGCVVVPHRLLHLDARVVGARPDCFRPERWVPSKAGGGDARAGLARSPAWRPFGGGKTMCSGRFLARYSVTVFVAALLRRFDVQLVGDPPFPRADEGRPVLGTMSIKEGDDFPVRISLRA
ncbi:putative cytochrome p450 [Durotheca rogersii]|uniref:putative cytochrome p450 n=1 Tax=Durotheca rogersii TaxID=419775 RepID=UPI00221EB617|nr:putative cytochrome p450 [Durotheca rogersii]KAI5866714.1 putative cytochrome p450 [Durotheca rogersii]